MTRADGRVPRVAVIGAGMSGLLMGIRLQDAGLDDFTIFEKALDVGGTWRENRYPGLSCDVPSHLYSYSFEPNPDWNHRYSYGPEIHAYFQGVARHHGLHERIRFGSEVVEAVWTGKRWRLRTDDGETHDADFVVAATGVLHHPHYPEIEGLDDFAGRAFHTARWPDDVDLTGKRVGVIGTGSTSIQLIPRVAEVAARLEVFQRTAQWVFPVPNAAYSEAQKARLHRFPWLNRLLHWGYGRLFTLASAGVLGNRLILDAIARGCEKNLARVRDPELRRKLTPDYQAACKRLIMSDELYPAIQRENVEVVTEPIARIVPEGVETGDGLVHELDVLVLATGFHAHHYMRPMKVHGEGGLTLEDAWRDGVKGYRTIALPGFPNFFTLIGPHSPIGNYSLIDIAEHQTRYVMQCLERFRKGELRTLVPREDATRAFNDTLKQAFTGTVWLSGCSSWYLDESGLPVLWPFPYREFRRQMRRPRWDEFELT